MKTVSSTLIKQGASVKGFPDADAAQTILDAESGNEPRIDRPLSPVPVYNNDPVPVISQTVNTAQIETPVDNSNLLVLGGLAAAAVYLLSGKKKSGQTVGAKKKKDKTSSLPLLIGAGVAAWYFFIRKPDTDADATAIDNGGPSDTMPTNQVPVITPPAAEVAQARSATAQTDLTVLVRDWPAQTSVLMKMTDAEILNMYDYFYSYVLRGLKLYRTPGQTGIHADGNWNSQLYDAIAAIRTKYNINI